MKKKGLDINAQEMMYEFASFFSVLWFYLVPSVLFSDMLDRKVYLTPIIEIFSTMYVDFSLILAVIVMIGPVAVITLLIWWNNRKVNKNRPVKKAKTNYALINNTHGMLIWLFVIGFPLNWIQAVIYVVAIFFVWVWAGEWNPIYKLNKRYRTFLELRYETEKKLIVEMQTSFFALLTSQWVFLVAAVYKLYPMPFLFLFVILKFLFKQIFFNKDYDAIEDSIEFYNKWKKLELIVVLPILITLGVVLIISLFLFAYNIL